MESLRTAGILLGQAWRRLENRGPYLLPLSAILLPVAYFLSIARPDAERTNKLINLAYLGGISLTIGMLTLASACDEVRSWPRRPRHRRHQSHRRVERTDGCGDRGLH